MMTRNMQLLYKLFMMLTLVMVVSCGTDGSQSVSTGAIAAKLSWDNSEKTTAKTAGLAPAGVTTVRIIISAADMTTIQKDFTAATGSGTIDGILPGAGRNLTAQGLDGSGTIIYEGAASNLSVQAGQTTNAGIITMAAVAAKPTITSMSPSAGAVGTTITITGTNFSTTPANNTVKFNGTSATVTVATTTSLTVTVPSGALTGTVAVTTVGGTATSANTFTVSTATTPVAPVGTQMGGARQGSLLVLTTNVTTFAGNVNDNLLDGTGTAAGLGGTMAGITTDGINLYVAESTNNRIRKIVIATGVVTTLAGPDSAACLAMNGHCPAGSADGLGTAASFNFPTGITTDGTNLYVSDMENCNIRKIVIATGEVTTLAGTGRSGLVNATGTAASFSRPRGITTDGINLYVTEEFAKLVRKIVIATRAVTTVAGGGQGSNFDGVGTAARFASPMDITTDGTNLYVSDTMNFNIRKIVIATGVVTTLAGPNTATCSAAPFGSCPSGSTDGVGTAARFQFPGGITTDGSNLYVNDPGNIRKIVVATGAVTTLVGPDSATCAAAPFGDCPTGFIDGTGTAVRFFSTSKIATDGRSLYVPDYYLIRKIQ